MYYNSNQQNVKSRPATTRKHELPNSINIGNFFVVISTGVSKCLSAIFFQPVQDDTQQCYGIQEFILHVYTVWMQ